MTNEVRNGSRRRGCKRREGTGDSHGRDLFDRLCPERVDVAVELFEGVGLERCLRLTEQRQQSYERRSVGQLRTIQACSTRRSPCADCTILGEVEKWRRSESTSCVVIPTCLSSQDCFRLQLGSNVLTACLGLLHDRFLIRLWSATSLPPSSSSLLLAAPSRSSLRTGAVLRGVTCSLKSE